MGPARHLRQRHRPRQLPHRLTKALYSDPARTARIVDRIPLGRPGEPEDLAGTAVFLAAPASDYITGTVIWVDGGILLLGHGI